MHGKHPLGDKKKYIIFQTLTNPWKYNFMIRGTTQSEAATIQEMINQMIFESAKSIHKKTENKEQNKEKKQYIQL